MEGVTFYFAWEAALMQWVQAHTGTAAVTLSAAFTNLGSELMLIVLLGFLYWCTDKALAIRIGEVAVAGLVWNPMLKNVVLRRRPYFDVPGVECRKAVDSSADIYDIAAQGYSFPSGHSTNAATVFGSLGVYIKRNRAVRIVSFALVALIGCSRVVLGVHFPTDVLAGWAMGFAVLGVVTLLRRYIQRAELRYLLTFAVSLPGALYCRTEDYFTSLGVMAGFYLAVLFERRYVNFSNTQSRVSWVLRLAAGLAIYLCLNPLLKLPFSTAFLDSGTAAALFVRFARYTVIIFLMFGVYPLCFGRFGKKTE